MKPPRAPKPVPKSVLILRRRVLEELRKPKGPDRQRLFETDAELARFLDVHPSHISHFLRAPKPQNIRGLSWEAVDKLAEVFNLEIWELFYTHAPFDDWRVK